MQPRYFDEIVGLRLYLALWVAIGHGLKFTGFLTGTNPLLQVLLNSDAAIQLFMIASGFVITNLLMARRERYAPYLVRRFFRLWPMFVLACIAGYLVGGLWVEVVARVPWQDVAGWDFHRDGIERLFQATQDRFRAHALAHATMLHGAIPGQLLPDAAMSFLPPAWSISLEWQFYLVAPLVLACLDGWYRAGLLVLAAALAYLLVQHGYLGYFRIESFLPMMSGHFAVGILSRLGFERLEALDWRPFPIAAGTALLGWMFLAAPASLVIWTSFLSYLLWGARAGSDAAIVRRLFCHPWVLRGGEASYSLYLVHRPVQVLFGTAALAALPMSRPVMLAVMVPAIVAALLLSLLTYRWVERPGMALGRRIAARLGRPAPSMVASVPLRG